MRDYGKVHTSFWISDGMRRVSDDARLLALYLLTGQHTNMIGCFRLPDGYVSEDLAWTPERVSKGFDELSANGFATRDSSSKWVLIRNFLTWNSVENPNQGIAALRLFDQVPDKSTVKPELARVLASAISHIGIAKLKGSERVLEPFLNQEQDQEQEAILTLIPDLHIRTWTRNWKPFCDALVDLCWREEKRADEEFQRATAD
ncbi:antitermination protein [Klebsiella variicola]|uniref:antitermination protein n=1 Tax=Klebsiella variicola TaxID=244366 RepID=UPI00211AF5CE|nr:antitermination protein [Klebsiella variicola]